MDKASDYGSEDSRWNHRVLISEPLTCKASAVPIEYLYFSLYKSFHNVFKRFNTSLPSVHAYCTAHAHCPEGTHSVPQV